MVALIIVSGLLVLSFMAYSNSLKLSSETKDLKSLMDQVAAKCVEMISLAATTNSFSESYVQMPPSIGNKQYWLGLHNSSSEAWLEGGLGNSVVEETNIRVYLPSHISASGVFISSYGAAHLQCQPEGETSRIFLASSSLEG